MNELQIGDQTIRYDREATAAAYEVVQKGDTEICACLFCKNFLIQRNVAYPASFKAMLQQLGIDLNKEGEVFECGPDAEGYHLYGGWFYLIGELVTPGENSCSGPAPLEFASFFANSGPKPFYFKGEPLLLLEFSARIQWVLPDDPNSGRRFAAG